MIGFTSLRFKSDCRLKEVTACNRVHLLCSQRVYSPSSLITIWILICGTALQFEELSCAWNHRKASSTRPGKMTPRFISWLWPANGPESICMLSFPRADPENDRYYPDLHFICLTKIMKINHRGCGKLSMITRKNERASQRNDFSVWWIVTVLAPKKVRVRCRGTCSGTSLSHCVPLVAKWQWRITCQSEPLFRFAAAIINPSFGLHRPASGVIF